MDNHPINGLMEKAMENIKKMVEVNTIVGEAIETKNGTVIIPVTKVSCGFGAGGSEYTPKEKPAGDELPFGGGSGGGVSIQPVGFLVVSENDIRFQMVDNNVIWDRLIEQVPEFILNFKQNCHTKKQNISTADLTPSTIIFTEEVNA